MQSMMGESEQYRVSESVSIFCLNAACRIKLWGKIIGFHEIGAAIDS